MHHIPVDHCPDVELTKLPNEKVVTFDGHELKLGSVIYFRFCPREAASEYVVVSDRAIRGRGTTKIMVVGSRGIAAAMDATEFVRDKKIWWDWYQQRYKPAGRRTNGETARD